jgi:hypothetical protein
MPIDPKKEGLLMNGRLLAKLLLAVVALAVATAASARIAPPARLVGKSRALILVGLPGDEDHETHFG